MLSSYQISIIIIYQLYSAKNDVPMSVFRPSNVRLRTLEGSLKNLPRFRNRPSKVIFLRICIQKIKPATFSLEDSNVLSRRLERSLEKTRTFSREDSNVLLRRLQCSLEKCALFFGEVCTVLRRSVHCSPEKRALFSEEECTLLQTPLQCSFSNNKRFCVSMWDIL